MGAFFFEEKYSSARKITLALQRGQKDLHYRVGKEQTRTTEWENALQSGKGTDSHYRVGKRTTEWGKDSHYRVRKDTHYRVRKDTHYRVRKDTHYRVRKDTHYRVGKDSHHRVRKDSHYRVGGKKKTYRKKAPVALVVSFLGKIHMLRVMVPASVPESSPSDGTFSLGK